MGFRDEFNGTGMTYGHWSLQRTTQAGLQSNEERLKALQTAFRSTLQQQTDRLVKSQESSAAAFAEELAYRTDIIAEEIRQGSEDVVFAIQQMSDYLGAGLSELRWAVERQTRVSQDVLRVLLSSLDNQSRQYWEQGVQCYEATEFDMAKERFEKALDANRTNHFAYQYLGFIGVAGDNAQDAIKNFELAYKFATTGYHKALALSHLARCHSAKGDLETAADVAKSSVDAHPDLAKFHCDLARYMGRLRRTGESCTALKEAIERDWMYWDVAISDKDFDSVRVDVNKLLGQLRERERGKAKNAVNALKRAIEMARKVGAEIEPPVDLETISARLEQDNVHLYRDVAEQARNVTGDVYTAAGQAAEARIQALERSVAALHGRAGGVGWNFRKYEMNWGIGCALWFFLYLASAIVIAALFGRSTDAPSLYWESMILATILIAVLPWLVNRLRYNFSVAHPRDRLEREARRRASEIEPEVTKLREDLEKIKSGLGAVPAPCKTGASTPQASSLSGDNTRKSP